MQNPVSRIQNTGALQIRSYSVQYTCLFFPHCSSHDAAATEHSSSDPHPAGPAGRNLCASPGSLAEWVVGFPGVGATMGVDSPMGVFHSDLCGAKCHHFTDRWWDSCVRWKVSGTSMGIKGIWEIRPFGYFVTELCRITSLRSMVCYHARR